MKKEEERRSKKPQDKNIMSASATQGGHKKRKTFYVYDGQCRSVAEQSGNSCNNRGRRNVYDRGRPALLI